MSRIAIIGATGAVGRELLILLTGPDMPADHIIPVASARSSGTDIARELGLAADIEPVRDLDDMNFDEVDVTFFAAGAEVSRRYAEKAASAGSLVIDNSSAFRLRDDVPLVVPQVNPDALLRRPAANLIANPNCSTIQLVRAVNPLRALGQPVRVILATYQAGSGGGMRGLAELAADSRSILDSGPDPRPGRFGRPLAFDLLPHIGAFMDDAATHEEHKLRKEPVKIMSLPGLTVSATAVRAPIFHCHAEAAWVEFDRQVTAAAAEAVLASSPGIRLYPADPDHSYPTPRLVERSGSGRELVHVGRVRNDVTAPNALWLWIVADNLWVGAAFNAVDILRTVRRHGWLS
jgi:aspartate-semialdehyde dehydrogenase